MENASKALIIAGGMLIAMMIMGLLVVGYNNFRKYQKAEVEAEEAAQVVEFNKKFEAYNRKTVRGYQMISLGNLTLDINNRYVDEFGYKPVEIIVYMTTEKVPTTVLPWNKNNYEGNIKQSDVSYNGANGKYNSNPNYYDMIKYKEKIYESFNSSSDRNSFKELYFECTDVEYDEGNGRVTLMAFKAVAKKK